MQARSDSAVDTAAPVLTNTFSRKAYYDKWH